MKLPVRIKLEDKKLGRERNDGQAIFADKKIEIDPRLSVKSRLNIVLHEGIHILDPNLPELKVRAYANRLSDLLWRDRWRRIEK
jgi:hypothetical protein